MSRSGPRPATRRSCPMRWARATPPGIDVGAAYMTITGGKQADRLVGAEQSTRRDGPPARRRRSRTAWRRCAQIDARRRSRPASA
ncbi:MAG: copper chaperone PCu(A)C [Desulfobacterales bacterium]|nr:copper chaperone PCu(A)C [Desulfobacterales bacterium]